MLSYKYYKALRTTNNNTQVPSNLIVLDPKKPVDTYQRKRISIPCTFIRGGNTYLRPDNANKTNQQVNAKKILQSLINNNINKSLMTIKYPAHEYHNRYNIWDNIADYIDTISSWSSFELTQIDKLFLFKLLAEFRENPQINPGIEYYCLRYLIRLPAFRLNKSLSNLSARISNYISSLYSERHNKKMINIFARNVHKFGLVKKRKSLVMFRTIWRDIYNCYSMGSCAITDILNKSDILNALKYSKPTLHRTTYINETFERNSIPDDESQITDSELDINSDIDGVMDDGVMDDGVMDDGVMDTRQSAEFETPIVETNNIIDDSYTEFIDKESPNDDYEEEIEELAVDPDEW